MSDDHNAARLHPQDDDMSSVVVPMSRTLNSFDALSFMLRMTFNDIDATAEYLDDCSEIEFREIITWIVWSSCCARSRAGKPALNVLVEESRAFCAGPFIRTLCARRWSPSNIVIRTTEMHEMPRLMSLLTRARVADVGNWYGQNDEMILLRPIYCMHICTYVATYGGLQHYLFNSTKMAKSKYDDVIIILDSQPIGRMIRQRVFPRSGTKALGDTLPVYCSLENMLCHNIRVIIAREMLMRAIQGEFSSTSARDDYKLRAIAHVYSCPKVLRICGDVISPKLFTVFGSNNQPLCIHTYKLSREEIAKIVARLNMYVTTYARCIWTEPIWNDDNSMARYKICALRSKICMWFGPGKVYKLNRHIRLVNTEFVRSMWDEDANADTYEYELHDIKYDPPLSVDLPIFYVSRDMFIDECKSMYQSSRD